MSSELPVRYIHGDNMDRRQTEAIRRNILQLVGSGMFLQYRTAGPFQTLLCRLLRHACQVTVLLFFVRILGPGDTRTVNLNKWHV
jgi:hypothetical protein